LTSFGYSSMSRFKSTTIDLTSSALRPYIPGRSSPKSGLQACLCWGNGTYTATYSRKCCTGDLHAQGIGNVAQGGGCTQLAFSGGFSSCAFS
jgi:hypothetical protein